MSTQVWSRPFGAVPLEEGAVEFRVWAPAARHAAVLLHGHEHTLEDVGDGVHVGEVFADPGDDYWFVVDGDRLPDPCSRSQPAGVLGPSRVIDTGAFTISAGPELTLADLVFYELHVGTFTRTGTFDAAIAKLPRLRELGITAIELMPVATFPGARGWGYDGVYTSAPHHAYGGPDGLARLVDAAHRAGLAVFLDVVYNHIGPGADAIGRFGPYFTDRFQTSWGSALDYAQRGVREWAIQNALLWTVDYRIDGLRLDAVHAMHDESPVHVLAELAQRVPGLIVSEMGSADFRPLDEWGHDAMWLDRLHHELHVLLTGERDGYYADFGSVEGLVRELTRSTSGATCGCCPKPRPGWQSRERRSTAARRAPRRARDRAVLALDATSLHGRGARRASAVSVLHRPHRSGDCGGDAHGPASRVRSLRILLR